jgi:hypothetical protein
VKKDAEKEAKGLPRNVWPELGTPANDDEDGETPHHGRDMTRIYAFAPRPVYDEDDEEEPEAENGDALTDAEADAVWAATEAHLRAVLAADPDDDEPVPPLQHFIAEALAKVRADATHVIPAKAGISAGEEHQSPCNAPPGSPPPTAASSGPEIPASAGMTVPDNPPSPPTYRELHQLPRRTALPKNAHDPTHVPTMRAAAAARPPPP